jgi:CRP/FNR family transcriptional regulator, cyclic AMP receptor protein
MVGIGGTVSYPRPLEEIPVFRSLTPEELEELESRFEPVSFRSGEEIFSESGPEEYLYVVVSGTVEVFKQVFGGRRQDLATMAAPTVIGEMGLMTEPRAAATVVAATPVETLSIPREEFLEMLEGGSMAAYKVSYEIGKTLADRMSATNERISSIIADLENARTTRDLDIFRDRLMTEWSF